MKTIFKVILLPAFFIFASLHVYAQQQLQNEVSGSIAYTSGKVIQLAESLPADKYSWAPADDVRSFAEVFAHIISANYFFGSKLGAEVPAGINMQTLEKELKTKEQITAELKKSYDFATKAVNNTKDADLATKVEYPFPGEFTNMSSILILLSHSNEHLGQLIAYARMNDITPTWSMAGGE